MALFALLERLSDSLLQQAVVRSELFVHNAIPANGRGTDIRDLAPLTAFERWAGANLLELLLNFGHRPYHSAQQYRPCHHAACGTEECQRRELCACPQVTPKIATSDS